MTTLGDLAHARAGDKGDTSILVVAPYELDDYARVDDVLRAERVAVHFGVDASHVTIHPVPRLGAFTVVVRARLDGGVTRSRAADPHGKTLSGHLLDLVVEG
ncbi:hypothetical protein MTES_1912 [Microbacterium testaceum StLB037]|uniref:AtuA-like ferredoxin-fold domain-containing protein n=1 Tax=Microbacterium testaceum (strain StLB037) TaxID=979556 RepID=E8NCK7_MICTS|nr:hypothetical protein [Microbacterium testaceum]BAJ74876.1 hypothetical protein MTES_1912 [Microbacterium testaceum StLB037]